LLWLQLNWDAARLCVREVDGGFGQKQESERSYDGSILFWVQLLC